MVLLEMIRKKACVPQEESHESNTEPADFQVKSYGAFLQDMKRNWHLEKAREPIRETDTDFIRTFPLRRGLAGKVMELRCPTSKAVSIFGKNQTEIGSEETQELNIKDPYSFTLRCFDGYEWELNRAARINIKKESMYGGISSAWRLSYGDLLSAKPGFQFTEGVCLFGNEVLSVEVIDPDIDIEKIEVSMEADVFQALGSPL